MKFFFQNTNKKEIYTKNLAPSKFKSEIGEHTYGDPKILEWGEGADLKIGKFCSIAKGVTLILGGEHRTDWVTTHPFSGEVFHSVWPEAKEIKGHPKSKGGVEIGNDVWIGFGATILSGVRIGNGAVIGAKSLVTKNVGAYEIVGGNPAKLIKKRFSSNQIKLLEEIAWWNWPREKIVKFLPLLLSNNINKFINEAKSDQ